MLEPDRAGLQELVSRYTNQPAVLPAGLRLGLEQAWGGSPVLLYALADLSPSMELDQLWVALGKSHLALCRETPSGGLELVQLVERKRVKEVRETANLGSTTLTLLASPGGPALAQVKYTHRQRRAMANLVFLLKQEIEGREVDLRDPDDLYVEALGVPIRNAQATVDRGRFSVIRRLLGYLRPYRRRLLFGSIGAALMTGMTLIPPFLTGRLIDQVLKPYEAGQLPWAEASRLAWWTVGAIAAAYVLKEAFAWVRFRTMSVLGELVAQDLRRETFEHVQTLSLSFFSTKQTGSLITRITSDTDRIWDFIAFGVVEVSISVIMLLGLGSVLIWLDWRLGLIMTLPVPFLLGAIYLHGEKMQKLFLRAWRKWSSLTDVLSDTIPGIRVVKAFNQEGYEKGRFNRRNDSVTAEFNRIHSWWTSFWPCLMLSTYLVMITVWVFAVPRILGPGGTSTLTSGTFVAFLFYMTMFVQPIEVIGQMARMLNRATSSAYRIFELLDTEPQITDQREPLRLTPVMGRVTFENVRFGYDGIRTIIKGLSFDVKPGEMIGLVGPSGSGKTTLINLIARFYEPTAGRILIDGVDLKQLDSGHYRRQVGMVLQDPYLFHGTVLENIRYGLPEATVEEIVAAAKAANAHDFIVKLPHGYDTVVGERGHTLSGGERQRVSIARAVLHDPRILILDEATSSVDTETERKIQEALDRLVKGRTVFAIAHRLSTLTRADRLFVIEDGRLSEQGTHAELLAKQDGKYKKLHTLQLELNAAFAV